MNETTVTIAVLSGLLQLEYCWMYIECVVAVLIDNKSADYSDIRNISAVDRAHGLN